MEREKICLLMARGEEIYNESFYKKGVVSRWYFSLTDEERDYLDASELSFCVPNTRRVRVDKKRREALRDVRERDGFLEEFKKNLAFLKKRGGVHYSEAIALAEKLLSLFKVRLPDPISSETSHEHFSGQGWNACLGAAAQEGVIPREKKSQSESRTIKAWEEGWNAAREELLKNKGYRNIFKAG